LQAISYGQLWIDSKDQTQVSIGRLTTNLSKLRQGIQSADSVGELNTTIREIKANVSTALNGMALTEQKRQLVAEIDRQQLQLSKQFKQDREQALDAGKYCASTSNTKRCRYWGSTNLDIHTVSCIAGTPRPCFDRAVCQAEIRIRRVGIGGVPARTAFEA